MKIQAEPVKPGNRIWIIYGLLLIGIFAIALALRVIPMKDAVFGAGWVNMQGVDGIYHLRLVENLLAHFPNRIAFDPYTYFPYGQDVYFAPIHDILAALCAWVVGLGSPDQHTIEMVCAYFPAVLGALLVVPMYFIGKTIFNRNAGLLAALISGVLPGTILFRSRLGFFDHHVSEIFFSTLFMLFLLLALKKIKEQPVSFSNLLNRDWKVLAKPLLFACLSGISLGLYLTAWVGGLLFVFLFFSWAVITFIISHLRREPTDYITIVSVPVLLLALLVTLPFFNQLALASLILFSLLIGLAAVLLLSAISRFMALKNLNIIYYPLSLVGIGVVGLLVMFLGFPSFAATIVDKFEVFHPGAYSQTIAEVQSIFSVQGEFTFSRFWSEYYAAAIIAPIAFIMILAGLFKKISDQKILLLLWTILMFLATAGQVRFASYLAVTFALLCAYFYSALISWIDLGISKLFKISPKEASRPVSQYKHKKKEQAKSASEKQVSALESSSQPARSGPAWYRWFALGISLILIFFIGIYPNIEPSKITASTNAGITNDWRESLLWMKNNTPLPFQSDDYYYELYKKPADGKYVYPPSAYGVMSWWDYGHMITQIAHRIPNANPTQAGAGSAAAYFLSQNEASANPRLDKLGSKYVVIDYECAIPYSLIGNSLTGNKFLALPTWANTEGSRYVEVYLQPVNGKFSALPVYYPDYYYSQITRLYNFHGAAVVPNNSTTVISFSTQSGQKIIESMQTFSNYEAASVFLNKQTSPNFRLVGLTPFASPVPLEKLTQYKEVYKSSSQVAYNNKHNNNSYIEIFQYKP